MNELTKIVAEAIVSTRNKQTKWLEQTIARGYVMARPNDGSIDRESMRFKYDTSYTRSQFPYDKSDICHFKHRDLEVGDICLLGSCFDPEYNREIEIVGITEWRGNKVDCEFKYINELEA